MQKTGPSYLELLCLQVKAAKELEENSKKIDSLLNWVASLEQKGGLLEYRAHPNEQAPGARAGPGAQDIPDSHVVGAASAAESLDEQYERLKVSTDTSSFSKLSAPRTADTAGSGVGRWMGLASETHDFPHGRLGISWEVPTAGGHAVCALVAGCWGTVQAG